MRISDWSSDVCSSDLIDRIPVADPARKTADHHRRPGKAARIGGDRAVPCKGGEIFPPSHPRQDARDEAAHGDDEQREADREKRRKSVVNRKRVSVRLAPGGARNNKKKISRTTN